MFNKFLFSTLWFFIIFTINAQTTENIVSVTVATKFGDYTINKEETITVSSNFDNKKQKVSNVKEVTSRTYVNAHELKVTDKVKKDLSQYKSYDEDLFVILTFDKNGKITKFNFLQESVLSSFNEFYQQLMAEVSKKMAPVQSKKLLDLNTDSTIKIKLTYTK